MRRIYSAILVLVFGCAFWWMVTNAGEPEPRKFGPEWTKDKEGGTYRRKVQAEEVRTPGGNVGNFYVNTEHGLVYATETDSGRIMTVSARPKDGAPYAEVEVRKDKDGKATELRAHLNNDVLYLDFDADGMIDALIDNRDRSRQASIILDGKFVEVVGKSQAFLRDKGEPPRAMGNDDVRYVFKGGKWKVDTGK